MVDFKVIVKEFFKQNVVSLLALLVSIVTLALFWFRFEPFTFDSFGATTGVLSILVTILIGWQVFNLLKIERIREELKREQEEYKVKENKNLALLHLEIAKTYRQGVRVKDIMAESFFNFQYHLLKSLFYAQNDDEMLSIINRDLGEFRIAFVKQNEYRQKELNKILYRIDTNRQEMLSRFENIAQYLDF